MQTSNQAIRNLGRHARHVATIGFTSLGLAAVLSGPALAQTHHSGERSDDFTMMPRNMTPLPSNDRCSTGQIAVGSTCVDVSSGAAPSSWVRNYLGETKCDGNNCASILRDGRIRFSGYVRYPLFNNNNPTATYSFDKTVGVPVAWNSSSPQITTTAGTSFIDNSFQGACWEQPLAYPNMDVLTGAISGWIYIGTGDGRDCSRQGDPNWQPPSTGG
jgi:hypothetical protein